MTRLHEGDTASTPDGHRFGRFELQPEMGRVLVDGRPVPLGSRALDVLTVLAERPGELVRKNDLFDRVWPGVVVEENNLQVQISALRKVLGPQAIATIPGRGYRLMVRPEIPSSGGAAGASPSAREAPGDIGGAYPPGATADLYGRSADVAALTELVRQRGLVTVVGPAGIGKTRLAQAVAQHLRGAFADGVAVVELAPLADPALVLATVARALGVTVGEGEGVLDVMLDAVANQHVLLVLDNCEHLLDSVDAVVSALRKRAAGVRILTTSQELLRHPDEHVYRLGPLAVPAEVDATHAAEAGAVQLFVVRVQALEPRFRLTDANVAGVIEICRRLDGIPLAIELAAARAPLLGVEGLRQRLDERFRLLTAGSRVALRRHQTLRAALEWSYGLLSPAEQQVFDRLGVFTGSFSLECAQKLAADGHMDEWAVLDHLGALVDKSLVGIESSAMPRYRMLETTRAFALERLLARGETAPIMRRHAQVTLEIFERFYDEMFAGAPPEQGVERLVPDLDNLRGALRWASEPGGDHRLAVALVGAAAAGGFLHFVVLKTETWHWCERLRPLVDASIPAPHAARFWLACAQQGVALSAPAAIEDARRAIALYAGLGDGVRLFLAWTALVHALLETGHVDEARAALRQALELRDPAYPARLRSAADNMAALLFTDTGELALARSHGEAYLAVAREVGSAFDEGIGLTILVDLDVLEGRGFDDAARQLLARLRASSGGGDVGLGLRAVASALMTADRLGEAEAVYREALSLTRRSYGTGANVLYDAAMLVARRGRLDDAARVLGYAEAVYAARGIHPRAVAQKLRAALHALLAAQRPAEVAARLLDEGRRLTDDAACELAFPTPAARS